MSYALFARLAIPLSLVERLSLSRSLLRDRMLLLWVAMLVLSAAAVASANEPAGSAAALTTSRLQAIVDGMRANLAVPDEVAVELVPANPLKASVERLNDGTFSFRLTIEAGFLDQLTPDELRAVVAHELGHVWIYTHHPYLQTEQLANQIALRVVSRDSLDKVYGKVWTDGETAGSLPRFPDQQSVASAAPAAPPK